MAPIVGIDASRYSVAERTGTETYSFELLNAMIGRIPDRWDIRLYANRISDADRTTLVELGELRAMAWPRFWTHARLSVELGRHRPELLFVPSHVIPLVHPASVVTVHDLGYLKEPQAHPRKQVRMLDATTRWNVRAAKAIIAISETTRQDLIERYGADGDRITVVHHGVSARFAPTSEGEQARVRASLRLPERFVLAVGTIQPRKNLDVLARAVAHVCESNTDVGLVLAGRMGWMADDVLDAVHAALPGRALRLLDYVAQEDLPALYGAASVVALVSRYEGFGLPVLEAMACGASVVISDTPALVEVAGGAAEIVPVGDERALAEALIADLDNPGERRSTGQARAAMFTWRRCAEQTISVLGDALQQRDAK